MRERFRLVVVALGICNLAFSLWACWQLSKCRRTEAVVESVSTNHVVLTYTRANGEHWEYRLENPPVTSQYRVGDSVSIIYDPQRVKDAEELASGAWRLPTIWGLVSIIVIVAGLFVGRKKPNKTCAVY
jgi:hypothetical protein